MDRVDKPCSISHTQITVHCYSIHGSRRKSSGIRKKTVGKPHFRLLYKDRLENQRCYRSFH